MSGKNPILSMLKAGAFSYEEASSLLRMTPEELMEVLSNPSKQIDPVYADYLNLVLQDRRKSPVFTPSLEQDLKSLAFNDSLTSLLNREGLYSSLREFLTRVREVKVLVYFFDLNNLKEINDFHGHSKGDEAIAMFGRHLRESARKSDFCVRWGGDEFLSVVPNPSESINVQMREHHYISKIRLKLKTSAFPYLSFASGYAEGFVSENSLRDDFLCLVDRADRQMYKNKSTMKAMTTLPAFSEDEELALSSDTLKTLNLEKTPLQHPVSNRKK